MPDPGLPSVAPAQHGAMPIQFRTADGDDIDGMRGVLGACYRRFAITDAWSERVIRDCVESLASAAAFRAILDKEQVHLAVAGAVCVGMVSVVDREIAALFVHPGSQHGGIGTALFRRAIAAIGNQGHQQAVVSVVAASAVGFYEKMGMRVTTTAKVAHGPCTGMTVTMMGMAIGG